MMIPDSTKLFVRHADGAAAQVRAGDLLHEGDTGFELLTFRSGTAGCTWAKCANGVRCEQYPTLRVALRRRKRPQLVGGDKLAVLDPDTLALVRVSATEAIGRLAACATNIPHDGTLYDFSFGWLVGAWLSDGWCNKVIGYTKVEDALRARFVSAVEKWTGEGVEFQEYSEFHEAGINGGIGGESTKIHIWPATDRLKALYAYLGAMVDRDAKSAATFAGEPDRTALFKRMPANLHQFSRGALLGLLTGLIEGDGSLSVSHSKAKPQVLASFSTSSPFLRDGVLELCMLLGIRASYCAQHPRRGRAQKATSYAMHISSVDVGRFAPELHFTNDTPAVRLLMSEPPVKDDVDIVPVQTEFLRRFFGRDAQASRIGYSPNSLQTITSRHRDHGYAPIARTIAVAMLSAYTGPRDEAFHAFRHIVEDRAIHWDVVETVKVADLEACVEVELDAGMRLVLASGLIW
jgi:hypothetical protein